MAQSRLVRNVVAGLDGVADFQITTMITVGTDGHRKIRLMVGQPGEPDVNPVPGKAHITESFDVEELPRRIRAPRRSGQKRTRRAARRRVQATVA